MEVLIVSKTKMALNKCCIGGITMDGRNIRLRDKNGDNLLDETPLSLKEVWDIEFFDKPNITSPHIEDVIITSMKFKRMVKENLKVIDIINKLKTTIWQGNIDNLFDNFLQWENGSGYINKEKGIPKMSVGFWISDKDLTKFETKFGIRYSYNEDRKLKYVGYENPVNIIPRNTLIRVSLARWFKRDIYTEERCYLQLSGWYDYSENNK